MAADEVGPQAARLCATFADRYGWKHEEVTREVIDAIEHHYRAGICARRYDSADSPWAVVLRAIAPPRLQRAAADQGQGTSSQIVRHNHRQGMRHQKERA